jgi:hypothetical protein
VLWRINLIWCILLKVCSSTSLRVKSPIFDWHGNVFFTGGYGRLYRGWPRRNPLEDKNPAFVCTEREGNKSSADKLPLWFQTCASQVQLYGYISLVGKIVRSFVLISCRDPHSSHFPQYRQTYAGVVILNRPRPLLSQLFRFGNYPVISFSLTVPLKFPICSLRTFSGQWNLLSLTRVAACSTVLPYTPIPVAARSKAWVCGRSPAEIVFSNPPTPRGMVVSLSRKWCVLSGRGLYDGLITRPEESYRVWCVWV